MTMKNRILVVDDDVAIAEFLHSFLAQKGYDVQSVHSGKDAIRTVTEWHPQLVLLDIMMPDYDGYTTLEKLLQQNEDLCVIMITALDSLDSGRKALKMGAADYITKPLDLEYLEHSVVGKLRSLLHEPL